MSIMINGHEFGQVVEGVAWGASILATAIVVLIVYLMVRPPRHLRNRPPTPARTELDPIEAEELWALVDRMEARLEVLERALSDQLDRPRLRKDEGEDNFSPAEDGRNIGRKE